MRTDAFSLQKANAPSVLLLAPLRCSLSPPSVRRLRGFPYIGWRDRMYCPPGITSRECLRRSLHCAIRQKKTSMFSTSVSSVAPFAHIIPKNQDKVTLHRIFSAILIDRCDSTVRNLSVESRWRDSPTGRNPKIGVIILIFSQICAIILHERRDSR